MKRSIFIIVAFFMTNVLFAQTENYKIAIENFQANYNEENFDEIFNSFSLEMQQALPLENTKQIFSSLKAQAGKIESKDFVKFHQETFAIYKTKFENDIVAIYISLDDQNKINGLFVKSYEEEIESKSMNALNIYPREVAEAIYSKSKGFPNNTELSIAIIQNGETLFYGIKKENDSIKPSQNQNKVFEIGSITKVFTSAVLASLVEDKEIKLTDFVNSYYTFSFKDNVKISFESLANHTSGLPRLPQNLDLSNIYNPYRTYGEKEMNEYLMDILKLENVPLKMYSYSNFGVGLLGYTLGLSQKTTFQELLKKRVFDKYKMGNSFTSSQNLGNRLVQGLDLNGEIVSNWDFDVLFGCGGILSTTDDLAKFANAHFDFNNKELVLMRKPTFVVSDKMKIGLAWHILKSENNKDLFWHNGGTGGYSSSMLVNVEDNTAVIILSNVSGINEKIDVLCFELINRVNKK